MARASSLTLSSMLGWTGRRAIRTGTYPLDLGLFIAYALLAWFRHGHIRNRATRRVAVGHVLLTGINPLPATLIVGLTVGFTFGVLLVPLTGTLGMADLGQLVLRTLGMEVGPVLTAIVIIGRAGSAMATELANMKLHGETRALEQLGIDIRDFFIAPRIIAGAIAQVVLATYFTAIALFGGLLLASLLVTGQAASLALATIGAIDPMHFGVFICKNLLFGLLLSGAACYSAVQTKTVVDVPQRVQRAITASLLLVFVLNALLALIWL